MSSIQSMGKLRICKLRFTDSEFLGRFPLDLGIPPLKVENPLESNPLKRQILNSWIDRTPCGGEVRHGVTSGVWREKCTKRNGVGGEVRHGVTSGVSCETSNVTPRLHRDYYDYVYDYVLRLLLLLM